MTRNRKPIWRAGIAGPLFTAALCAAFTVAAQAQIPSPLLYFDFEEGAGSTLNDTTGNDNHGNIDRGVTFTGGAPDGPTPGGGGEFLNGLVQIPTVDVPSDLAHRSSNPDGSYTLAAWMKPDPDSIGGDHFFWGQTAQGIHNGLRGSGTLHTAHWGSDFNAATILTADEWVHAVWTYDGPTDQANIYLNGVLDGGPFSQQGPNGSGNLILGGRNGGSENFNGCVDDVAVWAEVLSEEIITLLAEGAHPNEANLEDTDGDGFPDQYEENNGLDPNDPADAGSDNDSDGGPDGLTALEEYGLGTDPQKADTDDDGLLDGVETNTGTWVSASDTGTDPKDADTDNDGLLDGVETNTGTFVDENDTGTNPHLVDTDGDGASDKFEIDEGFDPTDENSTPGIVTVQPSFLPINQVGGAPAGYEPDLSKPGLDYQENHYPGGVIFNNNAQNNYDVHTSGNPAPLDSHDDLVPYFDHGGGGNTISTHNLPFPGGAGENFTVRVNGYIDFTSFVPGTYNIHIGADDTNLFILDTPDGPVSNQHNCCPQDLATPFELSVPGFYPIDNVFGEQGGGDWGDLGISGPGIVGTVALGDTDAGSPPVFSIKFNGEDTDGDDLPDVYELSFDGIDNLDQLTADGDFDGDGISDVDEFANGTNPTSADSDGDGLSDSEEIAAGTDPTKADSDGDGLSDGDEVNVHGTDPNERDTDGGGVDDNREVGLGLNPLDPADDNQGSLVAYWPMDGDYLNVIIDDFHGTPETSDIPFAPGIAGEAIQLDGSQNLIIGGDENVMDFTGGSMTVVAWATADSITKGWQCLVAKGEGNGWRMHRRGGDNPPQMAWTGGNGDTPAHSTPIPVDGETWFHVAGVTDSETQEEILYFNGEEIARKGGATLQNRANPMKIGQNPDTGDRRWHGRIDDVAVWERALGPEEILEIYEAGLDGISLGDLLFGRTDTLKLDIRLTEDGRAELSWDSADGQLFNVRSNADLSDGEPSSWPIVDGLADIEAAPPRNTILVDLDPEMAQCFFVVESFPAPPESILADDFESGPGDWTMGSDGDAGTMWEFGMPTAGPGSAFSGDNCWATNLGSDYDLNADVWLRSPPIDLTTAGEVTLNFMEFKDIEEGFDVGSISVLDAADDSVLAVIDGAVDGADTEWEPSSHSIPAEGLGKVIKIEFRLESDEIQNFWGWGIDDFNLTVP